MNTFFPSEDRIDPDIHRQAMGFVLELSKEWNVEAARCIVDECTKLLKDEGLLRRIF